MCVCNLWESKSEWVEYVICVPEKSHRICRPLQLVWQLGFYPLNPTQWQEHHHKQRTQIAGVGLILAWHNFPASLCNELRWIVPWCPWMEKRQKAMEKLIERRREEKVLTWNQWDWKATQAHICPKDNNEVQDSLSNCEPCSD